MRSLSRRSLLRAIGLGSATALAGCGGDDTSGGSDDGPTTGAFSATRASDGGYVLGGLSVESSWVARLDAGGDVRWQASPGPAETIIQSVAVADDGGVLFAGQHFTELATPTPGTDGESVEPDDGAEGWVGRLHPDGDVAWTDTFRVDPTKGTLVAASARTADGEYVVGGRVEASSPMSSLMPSDDDGPPSAYLARYSSGGERLGVPRVDGQAVLTMGRTGDGELSFEDDSTTPTATPGGDAGATETATPTTATGTATPVRTPSTPTAGAAPGELVVGGSVSSVPSPETLFAGGTGGWIADYESRPLSEEGYLGSGSVTAMAPRRGGGLVVSGLKERVGTRTVEGEELPKLGTETVAIAPDGTVAWESTVRFEPADDFVAVVPDGSGYVVLGDTAPNEDAGRYAVAVAYDESGAERWRRAYDQGKQGMVVLDGVAVEKGAALVGSTGAENSDATVAAVQQLRPDGSKGWQHTVDGSTAVGSSTET
jgi:hypothetical protein